VLPEISKCDLADDERMHEHACRRKQFVQSGVAAAQMIDPDWTY
jgi:hypothetical protein